MRLLSRRLLLSIRNNSDVKFMIESECGRLLKEDPQLMKCYGAMGKKLNLCLRRDGAHVERIGRQ